MEPLPRRMRERIVALYEQGVPTKRIAEGLGTSRSGTRRIRQNLRERGTLELAKARTGYASGLTLDVELKAARPRRRRARGNACGAAGTAGGGGRRADRGPPAGEAGAGAQKKSLRAAEQDRPDVKAARDAWHDTLAGVPPDKLVFVDESGARTNMARLYGRALPGRRVMSYVPHGH